ncbi:heterotrimeric G protein alpha subunit, partial [Aphelenchoides avenae]
FLDDLERIAAIDYVPSEEDILCCHATKQGVQELRYTFAKRTLRFIEVSGQKDMHRKWLSLFAGVNAIIFVAAASEYDQFTCEDPPVNRLLASMDLFKEVANNSLFVRTSLILFLNKTDIFQEKLRESSMRVCFPKYKFRQNYKNASQYMIYKFEELVTVPDKNVYAHLTCVKDQEHTATISANIAKALCSIH